MMKTRKSVVITALVLVALIIATGVIFAQGRGAVNQGTDSTAEGDFSTVSGGRNNNIPTEGDFASIGGGRFNIASGEDSTIAGGRGNEASGVASTVSGGGLVPGTDIPGNIASGDFASIGGGQGNTASGERSTVSGGAGNIATGLESTISGGFQNSATNGSSTIGGGTGNEASGQVSTVGGGVVNHASGFRSTVSGGEGNTASGEYSTVSGGEGNTASGEYSTVSGGEGNTASGEYSTVSGGEGNTASGVDSTIPGGFLNTAQGDFSFAAGSRAQANHNGTFVWTDSTDKEFASTGENQFLIRASGGVGIGTDKPREQLTVNGKVLAKAFVRHSAVQWKTDIQALEGSLEKIQSLRGVSYDWKADGKHDIGLIAEEVGKVIPEVVVYEENGKDAIGVDYAGLVPVLIEAVKEQQQLLEDKDAQIASLQEDNHEFEARIAALEESIGAKGAQTGLLPFSASVMWMLGGGLGLVLVTPGLVLGYRRFRRDE